METYESTTKRTAVCGPACTVVWEGKLRKDFPYPDLVKDESRLQRLRYSLKPGMKTSFFSKRENRLVPITIKAVQKTRALVIRDDDQTTWSVLIEYINVDNLGITSPTEHKAGQLNRSNLHVGANVGFILRGQEVFGVVKKLNPSTAKIVLPSGQIWHIDYSYLFPVCEGAQAGSVHYIEGQVIDV